MIDTFLFIRTLNTALNFHFFINRFRYTSYEEAIFAELIDNGLSGCRMVVWIFS